MPPKTIEIVTRHGKETVEAQFVGKFWAVNKEGRAYNVTHIPTGRAFASGYDKLKIAKAAAQELDTLLPFETEEAMQNPQRELRDKVRALWPLSTILVYGKDYKAVSKFYKLPR